MLSRVQCEKIDRWIRSLLWEGTLLDVRASGRISVHRTKGRIVMQSGEERILQGVRETYEFRSIGKSHHTTSKIVLIGEGLDKACIETSLQIYLGI